MNYFINTVAALAILPILATAASADKVCNPSLPGGPDILESRFDLPAGFGYIFVGLSLDGKSEIYIQKTIGCDSAPLRVYLVKNS